MRLSFWGWLSFLNTLCPHKPTHFLLMGNLVKKSFGNTETHAVSLNYLKRGAYVARVTANHAVRSLRFQVN
jgi:hypothetical protein